MPHEVTVKQLRSFGFLVGGIFALIGLWPALWRGEEIRLWAVVLAGLLLLPAAVAPQSLRWPYRGWMTLGEWLGWVNTRIILGVVFYGLFTPMGLVMRWAGRDPLHLRAEPQAETYRVNRQPRPSSHMRQQF
jgi:O-antigen/teichoic acid export membrane protein